LVRNSFSFIIHSLASAFQTIRITFMQGSTIISQYMNDQLKEEVNRDELVTKKKMTPEEACEDSAHWSEVSFWHVNARLQPLARRKDAMCRKTIAEI
jgi:hypothetical protein